MLVLCIESLCIKKSRFDDSFMVEAKTAMCELEFAYEMGMKNITLKGDTFTVIKKLQSTELDLFSIGTLIF